MKIKPTRTNKQHGFTAIELLISLFVAATLVIGFYQLFNVIDHGNAIAKNNVTANNLALSNLNKYPYIPSDMPINCEASKTDTIPTTSDDSKKLPGTVTQKVTLSYPRTTPCDDTNKNVVRVVSSVTYGPATDRITVQQVTFVNAKEE